MVYYTPISHTKRTYLYWYILWTHAKAQPDEILRSQHRNNRQDRSNQMLKVKLKVMTNIYILNVSLLCYLIAHLAYNKFSNNFVFFFSKFSKVTFWPKLPNLVTLWKGTVFDRIPCEIYIFIHLCFIVYASICINTYTRHVYVNALYCNKYIYMLTRNR